MLVKKDRTFLFAGLPPDSHFNSEDKHLREGVSSGVVNRAKKVQNEIVPNFCILIVQTSFDGRLIMR